MYSLSILDKAIVGGYLIGMVAIGLYSLKKNKNADDYYVGGRKTGSFVLGCLWMASWIGGATVIGSVDKAFEIGISAFWYCAAMAIGCIIFALTSTGLIQRAGSNLACLTYPELIGHRYGIGSQLIATFTTFLAYVAYTAGQFLAMAKLLEVFFGLDLTHAIWISATSMVVYTALGGFIAVTITGVAQALAILFTLALVMVPTMLYQVEIAPVHLSVPDNFFNLGAWGWGKVAGLMVTITLTFYTSMDSYTRCFAAKNKRSAKMGTIVAAGMVTVIAFTTTFLGISARTLMETLPTGSSVMSILILEYMPIGIKGLILIGLLAAIMSTGSVCLLVASANITQDIYKRFVSPQASHKSILLLSIVSTAFVGILGVYLSFARQDIIDILYIAFTVNSAGLFIPTIAAFLWKKGNASTAAWSMALSLLTVIGWYVGQALLPDSSVFVLDPVWPGLLVSALIFGVGAQCFRLNPAEQAKLLVFKQSAMD